MPGSYYRAEAENGDGIDDPSEDELTIQNDISRIAEDITIWMAARNGAKPSADF